MVALIGKMSRGRRGEPSGERASSKWRQAAFGSLRAASEKFGQFTWRKVTGSSRGFRVWSMGGPAAPVSIAAGSERGVANSNFWKARVRSSGEERPVRAARSPLANRLPVSAPFFPPRGELGPLVPGGPWGGVGPRLSKGIEVEEEVTPDSATVRCIGPRLLRLRTGVHTFELLSAGPVWGGA